MPAVRVSVVVPVFNSAGSLEELHRRIAATLDSIPEIESWELILVNDGSGDASWETVVSLSRKHPEVRGLDLTRNWGQHNALLAGIHSATGDVIVTLDDDLQNPPEEIATLLGALTVDLDLVYGVPSPNTEPAYRRVGAVGLRTILRALSRRRDARLASGFRAFRSRLIAQLPKNAGRHVVLEPLLRARTRRVGSVAVRHEPRRIGRSNYSFPMLVRFAATEIAADLPLSRKISWRGSSYEVKGTTEPKLAADARR